MSRLVFCRGIHVVYERCSIDGEGQTQYSFMCPQSLQYLQCHAHFKHSTCTLIHTDFVFFFWLHVQVLFLSKNLIDRLRSCPISHLYSSPPSSLVFACLDLHVRFFLHPCLHSDIPVLYSTPLPVLTSYIHTSTSTPTTIPLRSSTTKPLSTSSPYTPLLLYITLQPSLSPSLILLIQSVASN